MSLWDEGLTTFLSDLRSRGIPETIIQSFLADKATPEETRKSAQALQSDSGKKYGAVEVAGKTIPGKWIAAIMDNIGRFVQITDYAMKGAPETVGLAWWAIKQVLGAVQNNYKLYGFFGGALSDITEMLVIIRSYDKLYDERSNSSWKASDMVAELFKQIRHVYAAILDFSFSVKQHLSAGKLAKIGHAFKDALGTSSGEFEGKMGSIKTLKSKILESAQAAFQQKTFVKFDEVQETINLVVEGQEAAVKTQLAIQQSMEEIARQTKPKSRDDVAKELFEKNKKKLNPLPDAGATYDAYRKVKQHGTCEWIFKDPKYESWRKSEKSSILCVSGEHGVGRSVLMAAVANHLENELSEEPDWTLQYVSCESLQNSTGLDARNDSSLSSARVKNTIVYNLYEKAYSDQENDSALLDKCNEVFHNSKKKKASSALTQHQIADELPEFDEALESLAQALNKKVIIVIDAVEMISDDEEESFAYSLQELLERTGVHARIIVSAFSGCKFYSTLEKNNIPDLSLGENNREDIAYTTKLKLRGLPGWSDAEKEEAQKAIVDKAGSDFKYVVKVALPFLEEPWQRPLSNRLKQLPGGLEETYSKAIGQMAPNYRALLKTSLAWALLANGPVTVTEVMDAHLGTYLSDDSKAEGPTSNEESALYRDQIRAAGGPFLDCQRTETQSLVKLKDPAAVRRFFIHTNEEKITEKVEEIHVCDNCRNKMGSAQELEINEKHGHLSLAITLVKTLNSPAFQKRYLGDLEEDQADDSSSDSDDNESKTEVGDALDPETGVAVASGDPDSLTEAKLKEHDAAEDPEAMDKDKEDEGEDADSETSDDTADRFEEDGDEADGPPPGLNNSADTRYEMRQWFFHVRKAESLWPSKAERENSKEWSILLDELEKFSRNEKVFGAWQRTYLPSNQASFTPLHVAANFGLLSLTSQLLQNGADIMSITEAGLTPLHCAAHGKWPGTLKLLLENGAQPNFEAGGIPAFQYWMYFQPSTDEVKLLFDYGASCTKIQPATGINALHCYGYAGTSVEVLELLLDHKEEDGTQVDINAVDKWGETALHELMRRKDIPLKLLEKFLERGADVNIDDQDSQRPLFEAAWEGELEAMKIVMKKVDDIDDDDKRGRTALHNAAFAGQLEAVKFLLENGASITKVDGHNATPLFFATLGKSEETVLYILNKMIEQGKTIEEINLKTNGQRTPLRRAAWRGFTETVKILLERIESPEEVNTVDLLKGRSALHCAAFHGHAEVVSQLLKKGADTTLKDGPLNPETKLHDGKTALCLCHEEWAIQGTKEFEDTVSLLIEADPAAAAQDSLLIATAAINGSKRILEQLHRAQADLDQIDKYGWTPLLLARQFKNAEAEEFLGIQTKPTCWEMEGVETTVTENGCGLEHAGEYRISLTANRPISSGLTKFYYEVSILELEGCLSNPEVAIGFCTISDKSLLEFPGWPKRGAASSKSWAYHGDNGGFYSYLSINEVFIGEPYGPGDTIGCGVDFATGKIWYTRNGEMIEEGFNNVMGRLFPVLGLCDKVKLETNFGIDLENKPFLWTEKTEVK
ncbi:hypothetical protein BKA61DRAFT_286666 [Leptodontidium sp. MPI-SDFR-AT-0119]|nr:hypothetical protein BKA61DRAFT_286666 [Leptodontidium sp. MPI-SDFR-AT-0119]